ncbi:unnamed protein product [Prorocentrum cordatum]|uniref:Hint domain-containing protein n=1 Tax=Prorocentrum cordatum TaxID=2364126 RepID=A0ABN9R260_9DINO|nr:unnamed protein product [Polarella glacialis]
MEYYEENSTRKVKSSCPYDVIYISAVGVCACALGCLKMADLLDLSWYPIAGCCVVLVTHLSSYVVDVPRPSWLSSVFILVDCMVVACFNRRFQHMAYEATSGSLGATPRFNVDCCPGCHATSTVQTTFIMYLMLSYLSTFLLPWKYAIIVVLGVASTYLSLMLSSLAFAPSHDSTPETVVWLLLECVLLMAGCAMTLLTHGALERSEQKLRLLQEEQKSGFTDIDLAPLEDPQVISHWTRRSLREAPPPVGLSLAEGPEHSQDSKHSLGAPSGEAEGAPAARRGECEGRQACGKVDCLPREAVVWVEGEEVPRELQQLREGQRVLCYDSLGDCVDYVSVEHLSQDTRSLDWVNVALEDGTNLKMTADHPVRIAGSEGMQSILRAASLQPERHSIVVHGDGTRPVPVQSVSRVACRAERPGGRAAVSVRQSARYSIFVAEGPGKCRLMAVGSADLAAPANLLRVGQSNTFLHASEAPSREASAHSWPPSKRRYQHYSGLPGLGPPPRAGASEHAPGGQEEPSWQSSRSNTSERISSSSGSLPDDAVESVILPRPLTRLSDQLKAAAAGAPSLGSGGHFDGACRPCTFGHQGRCLFGVWCTSCHHQHFKVRGRLARLKPAKASSALPAIGPKSPAKQMLQ